MAQHDPHAWVSGETITHDRLNGIEADLAGAAVVADVGTAGTPTGDALKAAIDAEIAAQAAGATTLTVASTVTSAGTLVAGKHNPVDATAGALTMPLPTGTTNKMLVVEKLDATANAVTVSGSIRGASAQTVALVWQRETLLLLSDASGSWWPIAGHKTKASLDAAYGPPAKVSALTYPLVIAHRGGADVYPENTMEAYEAAADFGSQAVEAGDLQLLADGGLMCMHDATVDRTTDGVGNCVDFTTPGVRLLNVDAAAWFGGRWGNLRAPLFSDVLDRLGGKVVIVPEAKSTGAATCNAIAAQVKARGLQSSVIVQSFSFPDISTIAAAGLTPLYLMTTGTEQTPAAIVAAGGKYVCIDQAAASLASTITAMHAAGLKVIISTVDCQKDYDAAIAAGADGVFSNEPLYVNRNYAAYRKTKTTFGTNGSLGHGYVTYPGSGPFAGVRGSITGVAGAWRWLLGANQVHVGLGELSPVANAASSYTITATIVYDTPPTSDTTKWAGIVYAATTDTTPSGGQDPQTGYLTVCRWNGQINSWRLTSGASVGLGSTLVSSAIVTPVLSADLTAGVAVTSLPVNALASAVKIGHQFMLPTGQIATVTAAAAASATALTISSLTPSALVTSGTALKQRITLTIAKTTTGVTVSRTDDGVSASYTDSTYTGGYLFMRQTTDGTAQTSVAAVTIT